MDHLRNALAEIEKLQKKFNNPANREEAMQEMATLWRKMNPGQRRPSQDDLFGVSVELSDEQAMVYMMIRPEQHHDFAETL
jgi:hypothetical protein